jgi:hypothetical protein
MKILIRCLILAILLIQCNSRPDKDIERDVREVQWKYGEGLNVGDWLDFASDAYRIQSDTIFANDTPIAVVLSIERGWLGDDDEMEIVSINGNEKGIYHSN